MVMSTEQQEPDDTISVINPVEQDTEVAEPEAPVEGEPEAVPTEEAPVVAEGQLDASVNTRAQQAPQQYLSRCLNRHHRLSPLRRLTRDPLMNSADTSRLMYSVSGRKG